MKYGLKNEHLDEDTWITGVNRAVQSSSSVAKGSEFEIVRPTIVSTVLLLSVTSQSSQFYANL